MDNSQNQNATKHKPGKSLYTNVRVKKTVKKTINGFLNKVNRKKFGRKVRDEAVIELAVSLLNDSHIKELQEKSLTNKDRLEIKYQEFIKVNGNISKDEFIGYLLSPEISHQK